jgi:hypothetical protein
MNDVGMVERCNRLRFSLEPLSAFLRGHLRGQDFERYLAVELGVFGDINVSHTTGAEFFLDFVVGEALANHERTLSLAENHPILHPENVCVQLQPFDCTSALNCHFEAALEEDPPQLRFIQSLKNQPFVAASGFGT